jgi:hypothetical protein
MSQYIGDASTNADYVASGGPGSARKYGMKRGNSMSARWSKADVEAWLADGFTSRRVRKAAKRLGLAVRA